MRRALRAAFAVAVGLAASGQASPAPPAAAPVSPLPAPVPSGERVHLHRPGTEIDADALSGNTAKKIYTVTGNVVVHDDPKVDKNVDTSVVESDDLIELHADRITVDEVSKRYEAKGSIRFTQGPRSGSADAATLDDRAHTLDLTGSATVASEGRSLSADTIHYNTSSKQFAGTGNVEIIAPVPTNPPGTPAPKKKRRVPGLPF
jgi:lipopolysaccharide transport protein LptA